MKHEQGASGPSRPGPVDGAWLGELLEAAAERYEPDTERLRALVAARIDEPAGARRARSRAAGRPGCLGRLGRLGLAGIPAGAAMASVGAAAALAIGVTTTLAVTAGHGGGHGTIAIVAPTTLSADGTAASPLVPSGGGGSRPSGGATSAGGSPSPSSGTAATTTHPAVENTTGAAGGSGSSPSSGPSTVSGLFDVSAAVDPAGNSAWAQLDLYVTVRRPLAALDVTVTVAACPGLAFTGRFDTGAGGQFTDTETANNDGSITYSFRLNPGAPAPASGRIEFSAQFNHSTTGWDPGKDTYSVAGRTASSPGPQTDQGTY